MRRFCYMHNFKLLHTGFFVLSIIIEIPAKQQQLNADYDSTFIYMTDYKKIT